MNIKDKIKNFFDYKENTKIRYYYLVQLFLVFINDGLNKNIISNNNESIFKKVINSISLLIFQSFFPLYLFRLYNLENKSIYKITGLAFGIITTFLSKLLLPIELNETGNCQYENDKVNKNNSKQVIQSDSTFVSSTVNRIINTFDFITNLMLLSVNIKDFKIFDIWLCATYIVLMLTYIPGLCCKYFGNIFNLACKDFPLYESECQLNNLSESRKYFLLHYYLIGPITASLLVKGIQKWLDVNVKN
jgi:hypothetical protein